MTLEKCALEISNDTELGHAILVWLGYEKFEIRKLEGKELIKNICDKKYICDKK